MSDAVEPSSSTSNSRRLQDFFGIDIENTPNVIDPKKKITKRNTIKNLFGHSSYHSYNNKHDNNSNNNNKKCQTPGPPLKSSPFKPSSPKKRSSNKKRSSSRRSRKEKYKQKKDNKHKHNNNNNSNSNSNSNSNDDNDLKKRSKSVGTFRFKSVLTDLHNQHDDFGDDELDDDQYIQHSSRISKSKNLLKRKSLKSKYKNNKSYTPKTPKTHKKNHIVRWFGIRKLNQSKKDLTDSDNDNNNINNLMIESKWRPNLKIIYKNDLLLSALIQFMTKSYNEENILFLQSVQELNIKIIEYINKGVSVTKEIQREIDFNIISVYNLYIINSAQHQVNLSYDCLQNALSKRNELSTYNLNQKLEIFNECIDEIERLIMSSILSTFYESSEFQIIAHSQEKIYNAQMQKKEQQLASGRSQSMKALFAINDNNGNGNNYCISDNKFNKYRNIVRQKSAKCPIIDPPPTKQLTKLKYRGASYDNYKDHHKKKLKDRINFTIYSPSDPEEHEHDDDGSDFYDDGLIRVANYDSNDTSSPSPNQIEKSVSYGINSNNNTATGSLPLQISPPIKLGISQSNESFIDFEELINGTSTNSKSAKTRSDSIKHNNDKYIDQYQYNTKQLTPTQHQPIRVSSPSVPSPIGTSLNNIDQYNQIQISPLSVSQSHSYAYNDNPFASTDTNDYNYRHNGNTFLASNSNPFRLNNNDDYDHHKSSTTTTLPLGFSVVSKRISNKKSKKYKNSDTIMYTKSNKKRKRKKKHPHKRTLSFGSAVKYSSPAQRLKEKVQNSKKKYLKKKKEKKEKHKKHKKHKKNKNKHRKHSNNNNKNNNNIVSNDDNKINCVNHKKQKKIFKHDIKIKQRRKSHNDSDQLYNLMVARDLNALDKKSII